MSGLPTAVTASTAPELPLEPELDDELPPLLPVDEVPVPVEPELLLDELLLDELLLEVPVEELELELPVELAPLDPLVADVDDVEPPEVVVLPAEPELDDEPLEPHAQSPALKSAIARRFMCVLPRAVCGASRPSRTERSPTLFAAVQQKRRQSGCLRVKEAESMLRAAFHTSTEVPLRRHL